MRNQGEALPGGGHVPLIVQRRDRAVGALESRKQEGYRRPLGGERAGSRTSKLEAGEKCKMLILNVIYYCIRILSKTQEEPKMLLDFHLIASSVTSEPTSQANRNLHLG